MSNQNNSVLCEECGQSINATTRWCTSCNAKHFEANFSNWTSGSNEMDKFIRKTQATAERHETVFEWVKYSEFTRLEKVEFSKNNKAYWENGYLLGWNVEQNKWNRRSGQWVKLVTHYGVKYLTSIFLKSEYESSKADPSKRIVYGMTRDPVTKDYVVIEKLIDRCPSCGKEWMSLRWCRGCNCGHFESEFPNWTCGDSDIDDFIRETQKTAEFPEQALEWIPETQFTEIKQIGKGGYGTVFKAYWEKGRIRKWDFTSNTWERGEPVWVAMKSAQDEEFLEEVRSLHQCLKINLFSLDCYGITRHPVTQKYLIVMRFVEGGDLRTYLSANFATNTWLDRLDRLWSLAIDLRSLHSSGLVHRDLHGGNVLFGKNRRSFIADLGLTCKDGQPTKENIKGVLPYVAPEVICRQPHTKAADIYSFAIIMWEWTSCQPPFCNIAYDVNLALKIYDGLRPPVVEGTPECYVQLMKQCWDLDPAKRPTIQFLAENLEKWVQIISSKDESELLTDDDINIKNQFELAELERKKNPIPVVPLLELNTHPLAVLTSRLLPEVSFSDQSSQYQTQQFDLDDF